MCGSYGYYGKTNITLSCEDQSLHISFQYFQFAHIENKL